MSYHCQIKLPLPHFLPKTKHASCGHLGGLTLQKLKKCWSLPPTMAGWATPIITTAFTAEIQGLWVKKSNNQRPCRMTLLFKSSTIGEKPTPLGVFFLQLFCIRSMEKSAAVLFFQIKQGHLIWDDSDDERPKWGVSQKGEILVGGFNPFETYARQNWTFSPNSIENKHIWNHHHH